MSPTLWQEGMPCCASPIVVVVCEKNHLGGLLDQYITKLPSQYWNDN